MKKLQVKAGDTWAWVFCRFAGPERHGELITTEDKSKALPSASVWADDDLAWAKKTWPEREFRLGQMLDN